MTKIKRGLTSVNDRLPKENSGGNPTEQAKQNYTEIGLGNDKGSIKMGHVHKQGDVTSGIGLYTPDGEHQLSLDVDGKRKGWTIATGPGAFAVECGSKMKEEQNSVMVTAVNGDISIVATNGKIRLQGTDIELNAVGEGQAKGNIKLDATESIITNSKKFLVSAKSLYKIASSQQAQIVANGALELYGNVIKGVTSAVQQKDVKTSGFRKIFKSQNRDKKFAKPSKLAEQRRVQQELMDQ
mgnify:CR=1 FL=1|tara:strand:+ start:407 stop:1126 length:720 start_codon:yes stop_codon:yes gene_type:complete